MRPESQTEVVHRHEVQIGKYAGGSPGIVREEEEEEKEEQEKGTQRNTKGSSPAASDKKTDETDGAQAPPSGGYLWRISSSIIGSTTGAVSGAVGLGIGGIKWAASKGYTAGSLVVDTTKTVAGKVAVPSWKAKDKKE